MSLQKSHVTYIHHEDYIKKSDEFIPPKHRNEMVHSLIEAYGLLDSMTLISPRKASLQEMAAFHSIDYLDHIVNLSTSENSSENSEEYGIGYDCPYRSGLFEYCQRIAGGTIDAARMLCNGRCKIAIHWPGGWHHAKRSSASGYCYANDCVLGIIELRKKFSRVLYIDLDLHHGDGVEDAFCGTDKVTTLSFHKFEPGFFPGTGCIEEVGQGKGKFHSINIPLLDGIRDKNFTRLVEKILRLVRDKIKPDVVLCQMGADGLNEDPMRSFNLTEKALTYCVKLILKWDIPVLLVGGGGYNSANTARCWTSITAALLDRELSNDIPEHEFFPQYGPHFELAISPCSKKDLNIDKYLNEILNKLEKNLTKLQ